MPEPIKFGTDGWRGVIADDFTYANVRRVAHAIARYVHQYEDPSRGVLVAYDTRFASDRFAVVAAEAIAASGIRVQAGARGHAHACAQLHGARAARRRRSDDHLQPQSVELEWDEVQGQLRRLGHAGNHQKDRGAHRHAAHRRQGRRGGRGRFQDRLHRRHQGLRGPQANRRGKAEVRHRRDVRRGTRHPRGHLPDSSASITSSCTAKSIRSFRASIPSRFCRTCASCSRPWWPTTAPPDWRPMAMPTASAPWMKTAMWWTPASVLPCCWSGC